LASISSVAARLKLRVVERLNQKVTVREKVTSRLAEVIVRYLLNVTVPYLINFMPLIITLSGWVKAYRTHRLQPLHPFAFVLLAVVTVFCAIPAVAFVHFEWNYVYRPPWRDPLVLLYGRFFLLGPFSMVLGLLAFRNQPKWLFWVLELASLWLTGLSALAVMAY
jgi:hypothetical protein